VYATSDGVAGFGQQGNIPRPDVTVQGDYVGDRALIHRVTQRIAEELGRLRPDAVVTWWPDGGTGPVRISFSRFRCVSAVVRISISPIVLIRSGLAGRPASSH
jgi:hypothetical protein